MNRFDRILGILLYLRSGQAVSGLELARRFEVSRRTIYRDIDVLSSLGVPVYAERGREGGFQLLEGYFLPPLMFSTEEAVSLLVGLVFLHSLQATPLKAELETVEQKLLAAMPERLRSVLVDAKKMIGFEGPTRDLFQLEPEQALGKSSSTSEESDRPAESDVISQFLQAILQEKTVQIRYYSPYSAKMKQFRIEPLGMFWDRNRWYLAGQVMDQAPEVRLWRADRVLEIKLDRIRGTARPEFDVRTLLDHAWLKAAMEQWRRETPVQIRLSPAQARQLQQDWYYRHADFEPIGDGQVLMTIGESNCEVVMALLRWLGPEAELIEPKAWRSRMRAELQQMLDRYRLGD
jgi:predicted DNA-binding transcriptional regulator YafY